MSDKCIRVLADPIHINDCKSSLSTLEKHIEDLARVLQLAGNGARLKILFLLTREGEMCPCDFSDVLGISVSGVSQHLRKLKDAGLVKDKKVGQTIFYCLIPEKLTHLKPILEFLSSESKTNA